MAIPMKQVKTFQRTTDPLVDEKPIVETKADIKFDLEGGIDFMEKKNTKKSKADKKTNLKTGNKSDRKKRQREMLKKQFEESGSNRDLLEYVYFLLQEINFDKAEKDKSAADAITVRAEQVFKNMSKDKKVNSESVTNAKVKRSDINDYLENRYSKRLCSKMQALFDWSLTSHNFVTFHKCLKDNLLRYSIEFNEQVQNLKEFAFNLMDMNCDGVICENDLFSLIQNLKNSDCLPILYDDILVLLNVLQKKKEAIVQLDQAVNHKTSEILDLGLFLERAVKMKDKRTNVYPHCKFLQVLVNAEKEIKPNLAFAKRNKPEKLIPIKAKTTAAEGEENEVDKTMERAPSQASGMTHMTGGTEMAT